MLFEPMTLRTMTIPNRAWMSPMCQYSAAPDGPAAGVPTDWHLVHLGARAVGGAGLVFTEATAVSPEGRISPYDLGLWNDRQRSSFARIATFLAERGAVPGIQLAHAGRKASTQRPWDGGGPLLPGRGAWSTRGPSAVGFGSYPAPEALTGEQIGGVVEDFARAARRALEAGFRVLEIHGAHGYLLHEFLSPVSNARTDRYGGSFDNRIRLALEVVDAVRTVWPDGLPLFFRVSATDWLERPGGDAGDRPGGDTGDRPAGGSGQRDGGAGWTGADTVRLARELAAHGVDLLDVSSGGNIPGVPIPTGPGYQVPFAASVKKHAVLAVGAVGLITEPEQAERILVDGQADAVLLGRELLRDPYWPRRAAAALGVPPTAAVPAWPDQYLRALP